MFNKKRGDYNMLTLNEKIAAVVDGLMLTGAMAVVIVYAMLA